MRFKVKEERRYKMYLAMALYGLAHFSILNFLLWVPRKYYDGDLLSIGGNHTFHVMRRNVDINIVLLNNKIYGLTKGQCSPTSEYGKKTKSTPYGSVDYPLNPLSIAVGAGCTFIARSIDVDVKHCDAVMSEAAAHKGAAFIEIYQDCNIFNHKAWFYASQKDSRAENTILVRHGEPMIFGAEKDKGLRLQGLHPEVVKLSEVDESEILVHDETDQTMAWLLSQMGPPHFPTPIGVLRAIEAPVYESAVAAQYGVTYSKDPMPGSALGYSISHPTDILIVDTRGQIVETVPHDTKAKYLLARIRDVLNTAD